MNQLLLISSTVALALLVAHSWRTRGRRVTLAFFIAGTLYALARENALSLLMLYLTGGSSEAKPYVPEGGFLPEIGYAHIQVAMGWVFAMYLAWTISEMILRRIPQLAGRVFMIAGISSLFMLAVCWCMETTAVAVGWWYWELPTRSALFGNVNTLAMEGWFTVVPDFLLPFLVIACSVQNVGARHASPAGSEGGRRMRRPYTRWLWALAFPLHIGGHMMTRWAPQAMMVYYALELLVLAPMAFSRMRMARGEIGDATLLPYGPKGAAHNRVASPISPRYAAALLAASLAIFFAVLTTALLLRGRGGEELMTQAPLLMLCLLAWKRVPAWAASVASLAAVAGWFSLGPRALWALAPVAAYGFLRLLARLGEPLWMKSVPIAAVVVLSAFCAVQAEREGARALEYLEEWRLGEALFFNRKPTEADRVYARADGLRPNDVVLFHGAVKTMMSVPEGDARRSSEVFEYRIGRIVRELEELVRRDPELYATRRNLSAWYLVQGRLADAERQYREIRVFRPNDANIAAMLGYLLLREGKIEEAQSVCEDAAGAKAPPPEALVNLGVIRFSQRRDDEARKLWDHALARDPSNVIARLNLARLQGPAADRSVDERYLARNRDVADVASWVHNMALAGFPKPDAERLRLLHEASQMNPRDIRIHSNLVRAYLGKAGSSYDPARAVWHARRAVEEARESADRAEAARALLLLGEALRADGKPEESRRAIDEARTYAPPRPR